MYVQILHYHHRHRLYSTLLGLALPQSADYQLGARPLPALGNIYTEKTHTNKRLDSSPRSQCLSDRLQFMHAFDRSATVVSMYRYPSDSKCASYDYDRQYPDRCSIWNVWLTCNVSHAGRCCLWSVPIPNFTPCSSSSLDIVMKSRLTTIFLWPRSHFTF